MEQLHAEHLYYLMPALAKAQDFVGPALQKEIKDFVPKLLKHF